MQIHADKQIYLSLCSNEGNRLDNLRKAIVLLTQRGFQVTTQSIVLETEALLLEGSPLEWNKPYLNMVIAGTISSDAANLPEAFLSVIQEIEISLGRDANHLKWSPRPIDIDILYWAELQRASEDLQIPHREIPNRPFLLHLLAMLGKEVSHSFEANCFLKAFALEPKIVGIVNVTPDSFSDGNLYLKPKAAVSRILELSEAGAVVIDVGAQSTRPDAQMISPNEEWNRLNAVLSQLQVVMNNGYNLQISIDSFVPEVIGQALRFYPIAWINDVTGTMIEKLDKDLLKQVVSSNCKIVAMHSLSIPPSSKVCIDETVPAAQTINRWAEQTIKKYGEYGIVKERLILDPGIGFGKTAYQNLDLLRSVKSLKQLGCEVLIGHSRKSYISSFCKRQALERDLETIAISLKLNELGVDYLRVHNVEDHMRCFVAQKALMA